MVKARVLLIGLIAGPIFCISGEKPEQDDTSLWDRSYELTPLPDGKERGLNVLSINQGRKHLEGLWVVERRMKKTVPELAIQGHFDKKGEFTANVSLEVSDREDGNWRTIESSFSDKVDVTLEGAPHMDKLFIRIQLDAFQPYIGMFKFCRVVLQTGESDVFPMVWLTEQGKESAH